MTLCAFMDAIAGLALLTGSLPAHAEYPDRPVRIINPYGPGGSGDSIQRLIAQKLADRTGKTFIVELKPGASGRIAYDYVAKSSPDGYTLAALNPGYSILPAVFSKLTWDHASDLVPVRMFVVNYLWFGLMAPKGTPQPVVDYLHTQVVGVLADPGVKQALRSQAAQSVGMPPGELKCVMQEDVKSWGQILKAASVKPE